MGCVPRRGCLLVARRPLTELTMSSPLGRGGFTRTEVDGIGLFTVAFSLPLLRGWEDTNPASVVLPHRPAIVFALSFISFSAALEGSRGCLVVPAGVAFGAVFDFTGVALALGDKIEFTISLEQS